MVARVTRPSIVPRSVASASLPAVAQTASNEPVAPSLSAKLARALAVRASNVAEPETARSFVQRIPESEARVPPFLVRAEYDPPRNPDPALS
jgi:hypothetical protein